MEISEILFNELAFFRLMQDFDCSNITLAAKHKNKKTQEKPKTKNSPRVRCFPFSVLVISLIGLITNDFFDQG